MKRCILCLSFLLSALCVRSQNARIVGEICPGCGVYVEGRHLQASDHKAGCWWLAQQQSKSSSSSEDSGSSWGRSPYSDSNSFGLVEGKPLTNDEYYELLLRTHCDYCGGTSAKHVGNCIVGYAFGEWQRIMKAGREWDALRMRDNVVTLILGTDSGKETIHRMRGTSASKAVTTQEPSPKLKDYTPASERPKPSVGKPIMSSPTVTKTPQFSSINEHDIVYDKLQSLSGEHPWGEVDVDYVRGLKKRGWDVLEDYDIERYSNRFGAAVYLGKRTPDGHILWTGLAFDKDRGKYIGGSVVDPDEDNDGKKVYLQDVHFEAEGEIIVREYSGGFRRVTDAFGHPIVWGYNISILPMMVEGHRIVAWGPDPTREGDTIDNETWLYDDRGHKIAQGEQLEYYDDAIIARTKDGTRATLYNWQGQSIYFDRGGWNSNWLDDIQCYKSDHGHYYIIKIKDGRYALIANGFRQVGGIYGSAEEAHEVWRELR